MQLQKRSRFGKRNIIITMVLIVVMIAIYFSFVHLQGEVKKADGSRVSVSGTVQVIDVTDDGSLLILGMLDNRVVVTDHEQKQAWEFKTGGSILDIDTDNEYIFISSDDRKLSVLDLDGNKVSEVDAGYRPLVVSGSSDGKSFASGTSISVLKNRLKVVNFDGESLISKNMDDLINHVFLVDGGKDIVYITRGAEAVKLDAEGNEKSKAKLLYTPVSAAYMKESGILVVADEGGYVYALNNQLKQIWIKKLDKKINAIEIDSIEQKIYIASQEGSLTILDVKGEKVSSIKIPAETRQVVVNHHSKLMYLLKGGDHLVQYNTDAIENLNATRLLTAIMLVFLLISIILVIVSMLSIVIPDRLNHAVTSAKALIRAIYRKKVSYLLLVPTVSLIVVFCYYPAISGFILAFFDYKPGIYTRWVGMDNFISILENKYFWTGMGNMLVFLGTDLLKALIPSILFAELIFAMKSKSVQYWTRVGLYIPGILPGVAGLLVWTNGIYSMDGLINSLLRAVGLGHLATAWLGNESTAIWALVFMGFPWIGSYIIFYGALIGLPESLFDAAKMDGCGWLRRVLWIDLPMISPQMKYIFVVSFIGSVQDFGRVYLTTMGGPGHSTYVPMLELYFNMSKFQNYGVASAMGLFMFVIIFSATLFNLRIKTSDSYQ